VARGEPEKVVRPSLLDRLTGAVPSGVPGPQLQVGLLALKRSVARDLEWLLNTVNWLPWDLEQSEELRTSNLAYGIPDLSPFSWLSQKDGQTICAALEQAIRLHEPRLSPRTVQVELLEHKDVDDLRIRFRIAGLLEVTPVFERVVYDSSVDLDSGAVQIDRTA
jgi:type VI secretion system protein ImpF